MASLVKNVATVLIAVASPALANGPCPAREVGTYPWAPNGVLNGDLYAWVYLKIGKDRRPECFMGSNNIHDSDQRFFICRAIADEWKPARPEDAVPGTVVKRLTVMAGPDHAKVDKEARKRFFAEHPDERPECYPE